jgi:hypothetical protein
MRTPVGRQPVETGFHAYLTTGSALLSRHNSFRFNYLSGSDRLQTVLFGLGSQAPVAPPVSPALRGARLAPARSEATSPHCRDSSRNLAGAFEPSAGADSTIEGGFPEVSRTASRCD